jgi:hypothetical protein
VATDALRISTRGFGDTARDLDRLQARMQNRLVRDLRLFAREAQQDLREQIPVDTGDLQKSAVARFSTRVRRPMVRVALEGVPGHETPHDYTDVVRFGHRLGRITPVGGGRLAVHVEGHRNPEAVVYRRAVGPAYSEQPYPGDFVVRARRRMLARTRDLERRLGQEVDRT